MNRSEQTTENSYFSNQTLKEIVLVRYHDHVMYNRTPAITMKPQTREAIGWLIYECDWYIIVVWDKDAEPPTLHNGDPKASGLVLLKNDILELKKLPVNSKIIQKNVNWNLNSGKSTSRRVGALNKEAKNSRSDGI